MTGTAPPYHRGDLPQKLLGATAEAIDDVGVSELSLRDVARRAGVSHAAPAHHFGDKRGLLTAFAARGFELFADSLEQAAIADDAASALERFQAVGRAYVEFSVSHRAHFEVMWRPDMCDSTEPQLQVPRDRAARSLHDGVVEIQRAGIRADVPTEDVMLAAWSVVHGLAWLIVQRQVDWLGIGPADLADRVNKVFLAD